MQIKHTAIVVWSVLAALVCADSAMAQVNMGQWQFSPDGTARWQYLNVSRTKIPDLAIGDFDGDGADDVFYANGSEWFFSSAGTASWNRINKSSYRRHQLLFGDLDGNGVTDVFRANGTRWFVSFDGRSKWTQVNTSAVKTGNLALGDFAGDGKADVFYGSGNDWFISDDGVSKWRKVNKSGYKTKDLAFADFNGDGKTDVFRATGSRWYISSAATSSWSEINTSGTRIWQLAFADMTNDGAADIFYATGSRWLLSSSGTSSWTEINTSGVKRPNLLLGDFAGDGSADVFHPVNGTLYQLRVIAHDSLTFTNAQARALMSLAATVLRVRDHASRDRACPIGFRLQGNVGAFSAGNGILQNRQQFDQVEGFGAETKIVNQINWCGNVGAAAGCAYNGDISQVITRNAALGTARGVTLAHELGHGVHQVLAAGQGALMAQTPLTLAETASVFGEMLTFRALLEKAKDPLERKVMIAGKVEDMINTVVRQIAFYTFERKLHTERRTGELTAERIGELWMSVQEESLGPAIRLHEGYENYWSYIPHFIHSPFYVYAYAFGDCLVNSLYAVYEQAEDGFAEKYLDMLKAGGTLRHQDLLAPFGLDASDPAFWDKGLSVVRGLIDELEEM